MTLEGRTHQTAVQYLKSFSWSVMGGQVLNAVNILTFLWILIMYTVFQKRCHRKE